MAYNWPQWVKINVMELETLLAARQEGSTPPPTHQSISITWLAWAPAGSIACQRRGGGAIVELGCVCFSCKPWKSCCQISAVKNLLWDACCEKAESRLVQTVVSRWLWKKLYIVFMQIDSIQYFFMMIKFFSFKSLFIYIWKYLELTFLYSFLFLFSYIWKSLFSYI
jgi:hypothetical protein